MWLPARNAEPLRMDRLAFDLERTGNALALQLGRYIVAQEFAAQVLPTLGDDVAYGYFSAGGYEHAGTARQTAIQRHNASSFAIILADIRLPEGQLRLENMAPHGDLPYARLSAFDWHLVAGTNTEIAPVWGFAEEVEPKALGTFVDIYSQILSSYDHRCLVTGERVSAGDSPVVAIRSREADGDLHVTNYVVLCSDAAYAFTHGHIGITPGYRLLVDHGRISEALLPRLQPDISQYLPKNQRYRPDPKSLDFHLRKVFLEI